MIVISISRRSIEVSAGLVHLDKPMGLACGASRGLHLGSVPEVSSGRQEVWGVLILLRRSEGFQVHACLKHLPGSSLPKLQGRLCKLFRRMCWQARRLGLVNKESPAEMSPSLGNTSIEQAADVQAWIPIDLV